MTIVLPATGTLRGTVMSGKMPVAYANVIVVGTRLGASSDEDGRFRIRDVPAGKAVISVQMMGRAPVTQTVNVKEGENPLRTIQLPPPVTGTLQGRVFLGKRPARAGYVNIIVLGAGIGTSTGKDGRFVIRGILPGVVTLQFQMLGRPPLRRTVDVWRVANPPLEVRFPPVVREYADPRLRRCQDLIWDLTAGRPDSGLREDEAAYPGLAQASDTAGVFRVWVDRKHPCRLRVDWRMAQHGTPLALSVVDGRHQAVRQLLAGPASSGDLAWDGKDDRGSEVLPEAGLFIRFETAESVVEIPVRRVPANLVKGFLRPIY